MFYRKIGGSIHCAIVLALWFSKNDTDPFAGRECRHTNVGDFTAQTLVHQFDLLADFELWLCHVCHRIC